MYIFTLKIIRRFASLLQWEKVARFTATDEVLHVYCAKQILFRYVRTQSRTQTSTREVRHSPTWHSSESESALERFKPVAVVQQLPDGRGSVFAPVAARRQKELKEGLTHMRSMCVGVAETGVNSFLFLSFSFFSDKRKEL